jgi:hypothetical protein
MFRQKKSWLLSLVIARGPWGAATAKRVDTLE